MKYWRIEKYIGVEGMSIREFADKCGIAPSTMSRFLNGKTDIQKSNIDKILKVTGLTYEECFSQEKKVEWKEHFASRFGRVE